MSKPTKTNPYQTNKQGRFKPGWVGLKTDTGSKTNNFFLTNVRRAFGWPNSSPISTSISINSYISLSLLTLFIHSSMEDYKQYSCSTATETLEWIRAIIHFIKPYSFFWKSHVVNFLTVTYNYAIFRRFLFNYFSISTYTRTNVTNRMDEWWWSFVNLFFFENNVWCFNSKSPIDFVAVWMIDFSLATVIFMFD